MREPSQIQPYVYWSQMQFHENWRNINLFLLNTETSAYALESCMFSNDRTDEHSVEYASRLLPVAEKNHSIIERETFEIIYLMNKFRGYIRNFLDH